MKEYTNKIHIPSYDNNNDNYDYDNDDTGDNDDMFDVGWLQSRFYIKEARERERHRDAIFFPFDPRSSYL